MTNTAWVIKKPTNAQKQLSFYALWILNRRRGLLWVSCFPKVSIYISSHPRQMILKWWSVIVMLLSSSGHPWLVVPMGRLDCPRRILLSWNLFSRDKAGAREVAPLLCKYLAFFFFCWNLVNFREGALMQHFFHYVFAPVPFLVPVCIYCWCL